MAKPKAGADPDQRVSADEIDHLLVQFKSPVFKGKWRLLPPPIRQGMKD